MKVEAGKLDEALAALAKHNEAASTDEASMLTELNINGARLGEKGAEQLSEALAACKTLTTLKLTAGKVSNNDFSQIGYVVQCHPSLQDCDFSCNQIWERGALRAKVLLASNCGLKVLILNSNRIGPQGAAFLAVGLASNEVLETLGLDYNAIEDEGARHIGIALEKNRTLKKLALRSNAITAKGACDLSAPLQSNKSLTSLDLSTNDFGDEGAQGFINVLQDNVTLTEISLFSCDVDHEHEEKIRVALKRNDARTTPASELTVPDRQTSETKPQALSRGNLSSLLAAVPRFCCG